MEEPKTLCDTCKDKELCGSNSRELISPDDIDTLDSMGIKAKAVIYRCDSYRWFDWGVKLGAELENQQNT